MKVNKLFDIEMYFMIYENVIIVFMLMIDINDQWYAVRLCILCETVFIVSRFISYTYVGIIEW